MISTQFMRTFHIYVPRLAVNKSDLAKLRKKTGYTFANCKKALELNNNDISLAEKWLKEQAQALGWSKVSKLEGRAATQGLIGVSTQNNYGTMVEVNCETDFVARNKTFKSFVQQVAESCLKSALGIKPAGAYEKVLFDQSELKKLRGSDGEDLASLTALSVSSLGENIVLKRAVHLVGNPGGDCKVAGYCHPSQDPNSPVLFGRYGALLAFKADHDDPQVAHAARQICQHIIGMNPSKIGSQDDEPSENPDDESTMVHQEFLLDPSLTVGQLMTDVGLQAIDFVRFECGQVAEESASEGSEDTVSEQQNVKSVSL